MGRDKISELPDEVLCHILSFVPAKYVVRTSVLSTRWKSIWASVPILDFEFENIPIVWRDENQPDPDGFRWEAEDLSDHVGFLAFVDRVLYFRGLSDIKKLRLHCYCRVEDASRIDGWIRSAFSHNVVELDLCVQAHYDEYIEEPPLELPRCVFTCKTLVVLKLMSNFITYAPPTSGCCFPSLKSLDVRVDFPENDSMEKLFSCCPVLEDLSIKATVPDHNRQNFKVSAPELKRLRMTFFSFINGAEDFEYDISVNAPKLEYFNIKQDYLSHYTFENLKSLAKGSVDLYCHIGKTQVGFSERATALLEAFSNVKYLFISAHYVEDGCLPAFNHLTELKLVLYDCYHWDLLTELLKKSPNLQSLVVDHKEDKECIEERGDVLNSADRWRTPESVPICLISHLKTITIRGLKIYPHEQKVLKYLMKNGKVLDKMTIYAKNGAYKDFIPRRASRT